ncbi:MAG: hypothetical protein IVW36_08145 [Dehalococcoidia bacterium]|nr:hypothetical protein [Dehalococcoidia bacterium]
MTTTSRTLVAQIALSAAFGTALAWKTARARRTGMIAAGRGASATAEAPAPLARTGLRTAPVASPGIQGRSLPVRTAHKAGRRLRSTFARLPEPARLAIVIVAAAVIPIVAGIAYAATRADGTQAQRSGPAVVAPAATAPAISIATPTLAEQLLDARRALDLRAALAAADAYATLFGAYPSTEGRPATLCANPGDAGCAIVQHATALSVSDGQFPYWYASDGRSVTVLARVASSPASRECPADLPSALAGVPVLCLRSAVGGR